jgi:arabinose-5-phosphate isomerase
MNLAPTTSTTAMLAMGDALAVAVMEARGFQSSDYALLHPAGALGRRLVLRVADIMRTGDGVAILPDTAVIRDVVLTLPRAHQSAAILIDDDGRLAGLVTGGDLRRGMERFGDGVLNRGVRDILTARPLTIGPTEMAVAGLRRFREFYADILEIPVVDDDGRPVGMLMLKDLLRAGITTLPDGD